MKSAYDSIEDMLSLVDLEAARVCGDGNCGYYACLASGSDVALTHCRRNARLIGPSAADYQAQQDLRRRSVAWLLSPAQAHMLTIEKEDVASVKKQLNGKQHLHDRMGEYADGPALRAMAAVEHVHLVVISTFTGPSAGKGFNGHGRVRKGCPFDRVPVYPPNDGTPLRRFKSWAHDIVPVLLRRKAGVLLPGWIGWHCVEAEGCPGLVEQTITPCHCLHSGCASK